MYRNVSDFIQEWTQESHGTASVIEAMSDEKLDVAIAKDHNSLGCSVGTSRLHRRSSEVLSA